MQHKPQLTFWQIWNMCFGFMGIQFGFALQNANVSRIFQTLGAEIDDLPILWVAAPLTGLLVQPIVGYMSDHTWNKLGRRRPYFLYGALLASAALFIMPNSPALWMAAGMLWVMDASINVTMEPFRAFVGDMLPERQRPMGFAMQSFFIGIGSVVASALPWMMRNWFDISSDAAAGVIPDTVKLSFYFGGGALFLAVLWTVLRTKEYSPEQLEAFAVAETALNKATEDTQKTAMPQRTAKQYAAQGLSFLVAGILATLLVQQYNLDKELFIITLGLVAFGGMQLIAKIQLDKAQTDNPFHTIVSDLFHMPRVMRQLAVVQFFSWFALFSMWIYSTPGVTAFHYGASEAGSTAYNEGADWVGVLFASYNGFAALAAFFIPVLARRYGLRKTHTINLVLGGLGLASFLVIKDPTMLLLSMIGVGIAWASILSVPYALLSGAIPYQKMGTYMGIFNFFIVIPQLLAASILGLLVRSLFDGEAIYALLLGGISMVVAGITTLFVDEQKD